MRKGMELVIHKEKNYKIVHYKYYFLTEIEMKDYKLKENEKLLGYFSNEKEPYTYSMLIETVRAIKVKHIYNSESYKAFIKNLQLVQKNFNYSNEWYNNWIDYVNKIGYDEAESLIELLNDFYVSGMESTW